MSRSTTTRTSNAVDRRTFLRWAGAGVAGVTMGSLPFALGGSSTSAQTRGPRSLVCIFLAGGADSFNMYVPLAHDVAGQDHATYRATRGSFAVADSDLLSIHDGDFGLHPRLAGLAAIADRGDLAVVNNVGPLARPTTQADVQADRSLPQYLFAHDAQQKLWQTGRDTTTPGAGWGGSIQQAISDGAGGGVGAVLSPAFSIAGSSLWQAGPGAAYSRLSPTVRVERLLGYDPSLRSWIPSFAGVAGVLDAALDDGTSSSNLLEQAAARTLRQSIFTTAELQEATATSEENEVGMDDVDGNPLGRQLRVVARLIKNRERLGLNRQVFFVRMGGWDTHRSQEQIFPRLLDQLDGAIRSFDTALTEMGTSDSVTTFTASDFGRTLTINGDGTDHGWGGHSFVFGGAIADGRYGTFPSYATAGNPDDIVSRSGDFAGRLIPTTSVSQYGATLARWMGLSDGQLDAAFPDLRRFETNDLGFLR